MNAVLFRNGKEVGRLTVSEGQRDIMVSHQEPLMPQHWDKLDDRAMVSCFREVFERFAWTCPCCNATVFNSQNWMEGPDWFQKLIYEHPTLARYGS